MTKNSRYKFSATPGYAACTALLPFVLMLYQYQRNIQYLSLWQVLALCAVLAGLLLIVYFAARYLFKSELGAFAFSAVLFFSFFMYRSLSSRFLKLLQSLRVNGDRLELLVEVSRFAALFTIAVVIAYSAGKIKRLQKANGFTAKLSLGAGGYYMNLRARFPLATCAIAFALYLALRHLYSYFLGFFDLDARAQLFFSGAMISALILAYLARRFKARLQSKTIPAVALVMIGVMLLQNIAVIAVFASRQQSKDMFYKEDFNVEVELAAQPNIYWIHCDGMLGFDAMERFYGDAQADFTRELESRGFWLSREAAFEAEHMTQAAIPVLMSPYYYDRVLSWQYDLGYAETNPQNTDLLSNPENRLAPNFTANRVAREKNETVMAFNAAGYNTSTIDRANFYFYPFHKN